MKYQKVIIKNYPKLNNKEGIILSEREDKSSFDVMVDGMIVFLESNQIQYTNKRLELRTLALPKANGLSNIDLVSAMLKITEEAGELSQAIGKKRGMSGETVELSEKEQIDEIAKESLDVAQAALTLFCLLEQEYGIKLENYVDKHIQKLIRKGYVM